MHLFTDTANVRPGRPYLIGVLFDIEPGWHIYWKNAGDSGLPTKLTFRLPSGYAVGPIQFPVPTKLLLPGDIVNYAYDKQVMLLATVTPPATVDPLSEVAVDASWLVCQDVCLPGKSSMSSKLVAIAARPDLFTQWRSRLPVDRDPNVMAATVDSGESTATVRVSWNGTPPADVQFFPLSPEVDAASISCATKDSTTTIHYKGGGKAGPRSSCGLLRFTVAGGRLVGLNLYSPP